MMLFFVPREWCRPTGRGLLRIDLRLMMDCETRTNSAASRMDLCRLGLGTVSPMPRMTMFSVVALARMDRL